jgi:regulator of protease activity HflC (stomatin/prohibitin superfamily)
MILRRADVKNDITNSLSQRLRERGIITETVNIVDFKFSVVFTTAIESKVAALQAVLESQNKLERIKIEAQQAQAQAKGEADAAVARAEGQVRAIEILKAALTPEYLQYIYIDKLAKDAKVIVVPQGMPLTLSGY